MPNITVYTTPTCPFCKMAKAYFDQHKIEYTEKDVAADGQAREEMLEKSGQMGVPVTIVETEGKEQIIVGFDQPALGKAIGIK